MAESGTKRQRTEEQTSNLTTTERGRQSESPERYRERTGSNYSPSIFSVSPGEFFTMSPITLMRRFTEDIDRAFSGFGGTSMRHGRAEREWNWIPPVEIRQSGNHLIVRADLPGLSENDVRLEVTDEGLVMEGERKRESSGEEAGWHHTERSYGHFYRLIPLPAEAKVDEINANFQNGVLEITVPVPEFEKKRRQIPIGTSGQGQRETSGSESLTSAISTSEGRSKTASSSR